MPDKPPMEQRVCIRCRWLRLPETAEAGFPDINIRLGAWVYHQVGEIGGDVRGSGG